MPVLMTASYIEVSMKIWNKVPAGKRKIVGVDDVTDEEEYNKVEDMTPFAVEADTSILLAEEEAPYARHDHKEGTIVKRTIVNIPLVE